MEGPARISARQRARETRQDKASLRISEGRMRNEGIRLDCEHPGVLLFILIHCVWKHFREVWHGSSAFLMPTVVVRDLALAFGKTCLSELLRTTKAEVDLSYAE
jgi:hypothetical protein